MHVAKVLQAMLFVDQFRAYDSLPFVFAKTMCGNSLQSKQWDRASDAENASHCLQVD